MRNLDSCCSCWRCMLCPCKVRNTFLFNFWNRTILLCIACIMWTALEFLTSSAIFIGYWKCILPLGFPLFFFFLELCVWQKYMVFMKTETMPQKSNTWNLETNSSNSRNVSCGSLVLLIASVERPVLREISWHALLSAVPLSVFSW